VKAYTAQQIQQGAQSGEWARQNQQSGAIPKNLPVSETGAGGGGGQITNVSYRDVQPSGRFKALQLNGFSMSYPDNWQEQTNSQTGVLIAPPAGVAAGEIAYGVIVSAAQDQNANSLDQATQDLVQSLQQSNQDLQAAGSPRVIRVNGVEGRSVDLIGSSPVEQNGRPERERDWLVTLPQRQGGLLYLVFISPENDFSRLRPTFEKMLDSLQVR
jgi:hypothetical protein